MSEDNKIDIKIVNPLEDKDTKQDARNSRLQMRRTNEEVLRKKCQNQARLECKSKIKAFADCALEEGIMVVFKCREQNRAMSDCMEEHYSEEIFDNYLVKLGYPKTVKKPSFFESIFGK